MKNTLLALFMVLTVSAFGQDTHEDVTAWRTSHPEVIIMTLSDYANLADDQKERIDHHLLLIETELTMEAIQNYELAHQPNDRSIESNETDSRSMISNEHSAEIKTWLYNHPGIKIISQSYYDALSQQDREKYDHPMVLIIAGKVVTLEDIGNYEDLY